MSSVTRIPANTSDQFMISIYLRRDCHENGMTLAEYSHAVMDGTQPTLTHDQFVYQFGTIGDEIDLVTNWAVAKGLTVLDAHAGMATVKVHGMVGTYNQLFNITLETVTTDTRTYVTHEGNITIPDEINDVVSTILGLDNSVAFESYARLDPDAVGPNSSNVDIDPSYITAPSPVDLALAYQYPTVPGGVGAQGANTCVGIVELGGGWP